MSESTEASPSLRKGERTRLRIIEAAATLFAERGYKATTLRDLADVVGLRGPSLYNHFGSKEALYAAVLDWGLRPLFDRLATAGGEIEVDQLPSMTFALLAERPMVPRLMMQELLRGGATLEPLLGEWIAKLVEQGLAATGDSGARLGDDEVEQMLMILAMFNVNIGYFAAAPMFAELTGIDLIGEDARERQTKILERFTRAMQSYDENEAR